ncbi:MAG TPA: hypothetical protein VGV13_16940 [Methylomirabilota bacterium]|nr:hypothetical protein [Methylomirabilota bacterium]
MRSHSLATALALGALLLGPRVARAEPLVSLTQPGPWSGVSGLIGYGARLWFVNSVKLADHNSADVWSYDPAAGEARYERHLFSQDAGDPAVAGGLLYWPFANGRFSTGHGEYLVTNGREWQWCVLPAGEVFHVHAMAANGGALYAATSAWHAGLQRSDDEGATWQAIYDHPMPPRRVSRITTFAALDGALYAGLTTYGRIGVSLLKVADDTLRPTTGWPWGESVTTLAAYRGWLYGVNRNGDESAVWRTRGTAAERVTALDGEPIRALAAGPDALWAIGARQGRGTLWRSPDGVTWRAAQRFPSAEPLALAVYAGRVYVGTRGPGERGTLWGPRPPAPVDPPVPPRPLPPLPHRLAPAVDDALAVLDRVLKDPTSYEGSAARLRAAVAPLALNGLAEVGPTLVQRLGGPFPDAQVRLFGGALTAPAAKVARWYLLWAIALGGRERIPPALLAEPWTARPNRAEKYVEAAPGAAWAVAQLGQADEETLAALVARLDVADQPLWLVGDFVGALTALTGQRFGYDVAAWQRWWSGRQSAGR